MITCISSWLTRSYFWNYTCQNWVIFRFKKLFILRWFLLGFEFALNESIKNENKFLFLACPLLRLFLKKRKLSLIYGFPFALNIKTGTELAKIEAHHYNLRFVIFKPTFWRSKTFFQWILFRKLYLFVWLVLNCKLESRAGYDSAGTGTIVEF